MSKDYFSGQPARLPGSVVTDKIQQETIYFASFIEAAEKRREGARLNNESGFLSRGFCLGLIKAAAPLKYQ